MFGFFLSWTRSSGAWFRRMARQAMNFLLPPLCLNCDRPVTENGALCVSCWKTLHFVAPPYCARCGAPFDLPVEEGTLCGACLAEAPVFTAARSAVLYNDASKPMILKLKHADRLHPVPALAAWMVRAGASFWEDADLIVPVPLHRWRLMKRKYNQAALLAQAIGKQTGKAVKVDALRRLRATPSQGHLGRKERHDNVHGAFEVATSAAVQDKRIVLVDDVLTSGATVNECARVLLDAGAAAVFVLTLARARIAN